MNPPSIVMPPTKIRMDLVTMGCFKSTLTTGVQETQRPNTMNVEQLALPCEMMMMDEMFDE